MHLAAFSAPEPIGVMSETTPDMADGGGSRSPRPLPKRDATVTKGRERPKYLAAELGHAVDRDGEPVGLNNNMVRRDKALQEYFSDLWRQMQHGRALRRERQDLEREGFSADEIWAAGITETLPTSSTAEEVRRYKKKLLFRASVLEALLTETVAELKRVGRLEPDSGKKGR